MFDVVIKGGSVVDGSGGAAQSADIGVSGGIITEIGSIRSPSRRVVDADGAVVTPGWIDAHTHYDGQVTWDTSLEGSAANGVTTAIMGNCGVGFAPVVPGREAELIDLMEGVEDIPGSALVEGMPWGAWEGFPSYLSHLDGLSWSIDVAAQLGHGPLRFYVMGARAITGEDATTDEVAKMAGLMREATKAGAVGFSTSRIPEHLSRSGYPVPGTYAPESELLAIAAGMQAGGGGVFQAIGAGTVADMPGMPTHHSALLQDVELFGRISRATEQSVIFTTLQREGRPTEWRDVLALTAAENSRGGKLAPMIAPRPVTFLASLRTYHPFMYRPSFMRLESARHDELVRELSRPEVKAAILMEEPVFAPNGDRTGFMVSGFFAAFAASMFEMREGFNYEPDADESIGARAGREGREPLEYLYDLLLKGDGTAVAILLSANYADGDIEVCREMLLDPNTVTGLSDAGAHVRMICDMSMPTFNLTHWTRDRTRGERLPIELVVSKITAAPARLYGLDDRGTIAVGKRADLNVIDLENLRDHPPHLRRDLPAGGARFLQLSTGYLMTMVNGVITRERDQDSGARPGRVARRSRRG